MRVLTALLLTPLIIAPIACVASPDASAEVQVAAKSVNLQRYPALNKHKPRKSFTTLAHRLNIEYVDMGAPGSSTGDLTVIVGELLNPKDQSVEGSFMTRVWTLAYDKKTNKYTYELYTEVRFNGPLGTMNYGQILSDGPIIASEQILTVTQTPAIYGGSGQWMGMRGVVLVGHEIPGKPDYRELTFKFKKPLF